MMKNRTFTISLIVIGLLCLSFSFVANPKEIIDIKPELTLLDGKLNVEDYGIPYTGIKYTGESVMVSDEGFIFHMPFIVSKSSVFTEKDMYCYIDKYTDDLPSIETTYQIVYETSEYYLINYVVKTSFFTGSIDIVPKIKNWVYPDYAWFNSGWDYKKPIKINSQVDGTITNYPLAMVWVDNDLKNHAQNDGADIFFTDSSETVKLAHEIYFNKTTGWIEAYVNMSSITSGDYLYMYYGNSTCSNQSNPTAVWGSGYDGVYHFANNPDDSSMWSNDLTEHNGIFYNMTGIGLGVDTDSSTYDYLSLSGGWLTGNIDNFAIEIYTNYPNEDTGVSTFSIVAYQPSSTDGFDLAIYPTGDLFRAFIDRANSNNLVYGTSDVSDGNYHYCVVKSIRDDNDHVYIDGAVEGTDPSADADISLGVGATGYVLSPDGTKEWWKGDISELRLYRGVKPNRYYHTVFNNLNNCSNGGFFTVGTDITNTPPQFTNQSPANNSVNQDRNLNWCLDISDDYCGFNYTITCNTSDTTSAQNQANGTFCLALTGLSYGTKYTVWVNATENCTGHGLQTREIYFFTVKNAPAPPVANKDPIYSNLSFTNNSMVYCCYMQNVSVYINDSDSNVIFWNITINGFTIGGRNINSTVWFNFTGWHHMVFPSRNYIMFLNLSDTKTFKCYSFNFTTYDMYCNWSSSSVLGDKMEISIGAGLLGIVFTLVVFLMAFRIDEEEKKNIWKPILFFMDVPVSLAVGISFIGYSLFSISWWIGVFMFLFAIVLSMAGLYYGLNFGRK